MPSEDNGDTTSSAAPVSPLWARRLALAALIVGVFGLCVSAVRAVLQPKAEDRVEAPTSAAQPSAVVEATPAAIASSAPAPATATAPSSSETESPPHPHPHPTARFDARAARTALDALAPTLTDCNIPKGRSGKVEVVFEPDGHISSAKPLDMYVGTFGGKCVARHLKQARVPAYSGPTTTFTHAFVIPE